MGDWRWAETHHPLTPALNERLLIRRHVPPENSNWLRLIMFHIRSILLGIAALGVISSSGIAQTRKAAPQVRKQQIVRARMAQRALVTRTVTRGLFRGIQLTEAEKTRVKAVRESYQPKVQALRQTLLTDRKTLRAIRQRGDTIGLRIKRQSVLTSERAQARTLADAMRTDLRAALSAENQTKFDANATRMRSKLADRTDSAAKRLRRPGGQRPGRGPGA